MRFLTCLTLFSLSTPVLADELFDSGKLLASGIGMNPEDVEIAFQPFSQDDNRLERRYEGTGLGLPMTNALVDLHKGRIAIDGARGTRITVSFLRAIREELLEAI